MHYWTSRQNRKVERGGQGAEGLEEVEGRRRMEPLDAVFQAAPGLGREC
jgi:hypothetical protein